MPHGNDSYEYVVHVQELYTDWLMHKRYVVGVSIGLWDTAGNTVYYCLVVLVSIYHLPEELDPDDRIPDELDGVPVRVQEVGTLAAGAFDKAGG